MNPVLTLVRLASVFALCVAMPFAAAQSPAPLTLPDLSTLTFTGPGGAVATNLVHSVGSDATGAVYIGGPFTQVNGLTTPAVARLKGDGTLDTAWTSGLASGTATTVHVDGGAGVNIAVLDAGAWKAWRRTASSLTLIYTAMPNYSIPAIEHDSVGWIYVAEQAASLAAGFTTSANVYRFQPDGTRDPVFAAVVSGQNPCDTAAQNFGVQSRIHALRFDGANLYVAGDFTSESVTPGQTLASNIGGVFRIHLPGLGLDPTWRPFDPLPVPPAAGPIGAKTTCLPQATKIVYDMAAPGDGFVYLAGSFPGALRRFSDTTATLDPGWLPDTGTPTTFFIPSVGAIAVDVERHHLYFGMHAAWLFPGAAFDSAWSPTPVNGPLDRIDLGLDRVNLGGGFTAPRPSLVAYPLAGTSIIANYYQSILGRAPDSGGVNFWGNTAVSLAARGVSPNEVYIAMAMAFFSSPEFTSQAFTDQQFVDKLYLAFFHRAADPGGEAYWVSAIQNDGLTRDMVMFAFMFSPEFGTYMASVLNGPYAMRPEVGVVMDFYRGALARLPDAAGLKAWVNGFRQAQCSADPTGNTYQAAVAISDAFFNSAEYAQRSRTNPQYVSDLYNAFMRRSADAAGFSSWTTALATNSRTAVRNAFISTPEFAARVQAMATAGCVAPMQ